MTKQQLEYPAERVIYLSLDLECDYGTALKSNRYEAARETAQLVDILEQYPASLNCFLQTKVLDEAPSAVCALQTADIPVEFHAHSHTHPARKSADIEYEISKSVERVRSQFDTDHVGYRFPDGDANDGDYDTLVNYGVAFSSTVFPSWRPGRFNNVQCSQEPFRHRESGILELPFSVYSDLIRIPISISYIKFLGQCYDWLVRRRPPRTIIFDMHMHDLVVPDTFQRLPRRYRLVYARHKHMGFKMLERLLDQLQADGYRFGKMTNLYKRVSEEENG